MASPALFTIPVLRYMKTFARAARMAKNPRATLQAPITVEDVLSLRMIPYPFPLLHSGLGTDGGGLSYMRAGMFGMYALHERVCQMRGAQAQILGGKISVCHGVCGTFAASGTIITSDDKISGIPQGESHSGIRWPSNRTSLVNASSAPAPWRRAARAR
jgi:hypothetical protein